MESDVQDSYGDLRENVREFCRKEVIPVASKVDLEDSFPLDLFRKMGKMGYLGITIPEEYEGAGMDYTAQGIIQEELGYASASIALSYGAHSNLCLDSLYRNGSDHVKEKYVPKLCSGEWIGSLCLTEPSSGSDALAMKTSARREGDHFILNGSKTLITNAPYADLMLTYARTGGDYTAFAVLAEDDGVRRGKSFKKLGMKGSPTGELFFQDVKIPEERIIGRENGAKDVILSGLNVERAILAMLFLGLSRRALELALSYSLERRQGGIPIADYELIQEKISYMYTRIEASRLLCTRALQRVQRDRFNVSDSASAILYAAEVAEYAAREALQIYGGYGYISGSEVERLLRDAVLGQIGAGTTEIRKRIVARAVTKMFREGWRP